MTQKIFFERRSGRDRRSGHDQRRNPRLDLPQRRRRRQPDRRANRTRVEDFYALHGSPCTQDPTPSSEVH